MANYNLTNQPISASFQQLLQKNDSDFLVDGTGSLIQSLKVTGSVSSSTYYGDGSNLTGISGEGAETGSLIKTASISDATITFTKGDASQFSIEVDNVTSSLETQDVFVNVKNTSGSPINKGLAVHATGVTGENINIILADSSNSANMPAIGLLNETLANNAVGQAIISGRIKNIDTSGLVAGASVYVNGAGTLTSSKPTGSDLIQNIGIAGKINATEGEIIVVGSGRSNDLPNLTEGYIWVGDSNGVPEAISTGSFATTGSNTFNGNQIVSGSVTVSDPSSTAFVVTSGPGDISPVIIEGGENFIDKFTSSRIRGVDVIGALKISGSWGDVGYRPGVNNGVGIYNNATSSNSNVVIRHNANVEPKYEAYSSLPAQSGGTESQLDLKGTEITISASTGSKQTSVDIQGSVSSSIAKSNVIVNPQTITDDVTIGENSNALVVGDVTFAGSVTIGSGSELTIFDEPNLGGLIETASISGQTLTFTKQDTSTFDIQIPAQSFDTGSFLTTASYEIDSASFDSRIDGNASLTNNNTFTGNQIVSGSFTAVGGIELGNISQYPGGTATLGVYGGITLRSGSGIQTDGAFGNSVPFDTNVAFFSGIDMQGTDITQTQALNLNAQDPLPGAPSSGDGKLAASGSAGAVNLYWHNGTSWAKLN